MQTSGLAAWPATSRGSPSLHAINDANRYRHGYNSLSGAKYEEILIVVDLRAIVDPQRADAGILFSSSTFSTQTVSVSCDLLVIVFPLPILRMLGATHVRVHTAFLLLRNLQLVARSTEVVAVSDDLEVVRAPLDRVCHIHGLAVALQWLSWVGLRS